MYKVTIELKNLDDIVTKMGVVIKDLESGLVSALKTTGILVQKQMRENTPVDTGNLRRSIDYNLDLSGLAVTIKPNPDTAPYAPYVEYGHHTRSGSFVQGQFYVRKTKEETQEFILELFKRVVENASSKF